MLCVLCHAHRPVVQLDFVAHHGAEIPVCADHLDAEEESAHVSDRDLIDGAVALWLDGLDGDLTLDQPLPWAVS